MSDWVGQASAVPAVTSTPQCIEYITVAALRAEYGEEIEDKTDAALQRQIDQMTVFLEDQLGHTFGRALVASSTATESVEITATKLIIGGDEYAFATYTTLYALVAAVNAAGETYSLELLPNIRGDTPTTLLGERAATTCGRDYEDRVVLCVSAMYCVLNGVCETKMFLPLPLAEIVAVTENGTALTTTDYWAIPG